jgi:hypothetical protein
MRIAPISKLALIAAVAGVLGATAPSLAQDAMQAPGQKHIGGKPAMIPSLAVLNSGGASLREGKLTMTGITPNSIIFADRPWRSAGHVLTSEFIKQWDEGQDSFAKDPPNATVSVFGSDGKSVEDAVVVLMSPKLEGSTLTFDVSVLEGEIKAADGPASLFIDWFAARGPRGGVAVGGGAWRAGGWGYHAPVWHGAYYAHPVGAFAAGAAVGAAAASAYHPYYPACGYYPYPPCY